MASDTSLVFNLLGRDNISKVLDAVKNAFRSAGRTAESSMSEADRAVEKVDKQINETKRHLAELAAEFAATGDKTLFGKMARDRALISNLQKVRAEIKGAGDDGENAGGRLSQLVSMFSDGASRVSGFASQLASFGSTISGIAGPIWSVVAALLAVAGALAALGPAVALAGGALGSLPGILGGGIAAFGTLKLGLSGLSSEYDRLTKSTGGGGGGGGAVKAAKDFTAANRAVESAVRGVTTAERQVTEAQAAALAAQKAINDARETASKRMRDQALDLQSARLDQKDADQAVIDAQTALNNALANGDPTAANAAAEALDRAKIAAAQAKNKVDDLTEANTQNAKKGVEGSDEVVAAKKQEADARQRVADSIEQEKEAEERLQDARKALADQKKQAASGGGGGGGGAGQQITQLAPAARDFLNTILRLRPAFTALRLDVQQKLFAGLAKPLQLLAERWLPQLHKTLGGFASTFNGIVKTVFATASKKTFIDNMAAGAEAFRGALGEVGKAIGGPLLDAFGKLAAASTPFVTELGHLLAGTITKISDLINKADSNKLKGFFKGAADTLGKVWDLGGKVAKIIGQVVAIIYPTAKSTGDGVLDAASNALQMISVWLSDPKNQGKIRNLAQSISDWVSKLEGFIGSMKKLAPLVGLTFKIVDAAFQASAFMIYLTTKAFGGFIDAFKWVWKNAPKAWDAVKSGLSSAYNWTVTKGGQLINWVKSLPKKIHSAAGGMWDGIKDGFRSAVNWVISKWNNLSFTIGGGTFLGMSIPSASFGTPNIPYLAKGGDVQRGGMAIVGERGPELVQLSRGAQVTPLRGGGGGGGSSVVVFDVRGADTEFGRLLLKILRNQPAVTQTARKHLGIA